MAYISLTDKAQQIIADVLQEGDIAIDATVGNGHDTVFLAKAVGSTGHVFGFDVQSESIANTRKQLQQQNLQQRVTLFQQDHADLAACIPDSMKTRIKAVMFNLGYLPGGDKSLVTRDHSTLQALNAVLPHLLPGGVITIVAYRGHSGGQDETRAVRDWCTQLDKLSYTVELFNSLAESETAPILMVIKRHFYLP
jgi:predicted methyltransferase